MNRNSILLRRKNRVIVPRGESALPAAHVATINQNFEGLGYTLSRDVMEAVGRLDLEEALRFHEEVLAVLRELRGVEDYRPMYPNFPRQVMEAGRAELYLNAVWHYLSAWVSDVRGDERRRRVWLPSFRKEERAPLDDKGVELTVIELGTEDDLRQIFARMVASKASISETDRAELKWFVENYGLELPDSIPNREVLAFVGSLMPDNTELRGHVKTATDVLRLAVALSGGDVSLAEPTKFRSFTRKERRSLLALLENCGNVIEDMLRWEGRWLRLGERLHPGEYAVRYPSAAKAFDLLRVGVPVETFNSRVERAVRSGDLGGAVDLLRDRPGEFARRLDQLVRVSGGGAEVVSLFGEIAHGVSTPVLLQTAAHFKHRNEARDLRIFFPKGSLAKVMAVDYNLPALAPQVCEALVKVCEGVLADRFSRLAPLGRVFIDERLKDYLVPFSQRSASRSLRTLVRGSKLPLPAGGDTVRFFLWWKEGEAGGKPTGRVDLDLSAVLYDARWLYKEHVSYTNLRAAAYRACHSGDITAAPEGACEFIDVDIPSVLACGARYVVMSVNSYTGQKFVGLPECRAGWMMRREPDSGEVFEPKTVADKVDVASDTTICLPLVLDLEARRVIWADIGLKRNPLYVNNVEGNYAQMTLLGKSLTEIVKPDLHTLFRLHAEARGTRVATEAEADTIFSPERGVTPFDLETIASEFL